MNIKFNIVDEKNFIYEMNAYTMNPKIEINKENLIKKYIEKINEDFLDDIIDKNIKKFYTENKISNIRK